MTTGGRLRRLESLQSPGGVYSSKNISAPSEENAEVEDGGHNMNCMNCQGGSARTDKCVLVVEGQEND